MKNPFNGRMPTFDAHAITETIQQALASAGLKTAGGPMGDVTDSLRRTFAARQAAGLAAPGSLRPERGGIIDTEAHEFTNSAGTRAYRVHVPATWPGRPRAMIVMLHGCTQSADDFAAGTQMNRLADEHGFLVLYPEQSARANASKCWNWFRPEDQVRDAGEPSIIAGIVQDVAQRHAVDARHIFVAGLSAGAAMAVVLGQTYPELFAGVGVHSGLPYRSAHDIPSAMAAMKGGRSGMSGLKTMPTGAGTKATHTAGAVHATPTIVFHGDRDHTVQHSNADHIVGQALQAQAKAATGRLSASSEAGMAPGGRAYSREVHADARGKVLIEHWTLHGGGHAWSGGDATGSYTDTAGPDASAEMVRFFMAL